MKTIEIDIADEWVTIKGKKVLLVQVNGFDIGTVEKFSLNSDALIWDHEPLKDDCLELCEILSYVQMNAPEYKLSEKEKKEKQVLEYEDKLREELCYKVDNYRKDLGLENN